jgi:hypothetical protein
MDEDTEDDDVVTERELIEGVTERTVAALRKLAKEGLITRDQKRRLLTDVIRHHQQVCERDRETERQGDGETGTEPDVETEEAPDGCHSPSPAGAAAYPDVFCGVFMMSLRARCHTLAKRTLAPKVLRCTAAYCRPGRRG